MTLQADKPMRVHGGADAIGVARFDFSTNSNACGPCPQSLHAVQHADATHYPDPDYRDLCQALADFHAVDVRRVVLAGSASEFIFRISALAAQRASARGEIAQVWLPACAYGDYAYAAQAWGLSQVQDPQAAQLLWACEPSSPLGQAHSVWPASLQVWRAPRNCCHKAAEPWKTPASGPRMRRAMGSGGVLIFEPN